MIDASQIAADLAAAERERKELTPFSDAHPDLDADTAGLVGVPSSSVYARATAIAVVFAMIKALRDR